MFVYTAKMDRKKLLVAALLIIAAAAAILVMLVVKGASAVETLSSSAVVKTNEQRVEYLEKLGWEVSEEPMEEQTVVIPEELSGVRDLQKVDRGVSFLYAGDINELIRVLSQHQISDLTVAEPDLEEIFMHYYLDGGEA